MSEASHRNVLPDLAPKVSISGDYLISTDGKSVQAEEGDQPVTLWKDLGGAVALIITPELKLSITVAGRNIVKSIPEWHRGALERIGGPGYGEKLQPPTFGFGPEADNAFASPPASPPPVKAVLRCFWCGAEGAKLVEGDDVICDECAFPKPPGVWIFVSGIIAGAALCEAVNIMLRSFNL